MIPATRVQSALRTAFPFSPTAGQDGFINQFSGFSTDTEQGIFLLRGYAGTGKTTVLSALTSIFKKTVLLAPTGRAAKVLSSYTDRPAFTIHRHLYRPAAASDGRILLAVAENKYRNTLFIVDESSMIPDASIDEPGASFPGVNLLSDLISYVFSGEGCKLLLVGDTAQLPPVHFDYSPALDANHLRNRYRLPVQEVEMTEVVRQKEASGILKNATALRILISRNAAYPVLKSKDFPDVIIVNPRETPELMQNAYNEFGKDEVLVITRSNKSAIQYNRLIRFQLLWMEDEISGGDSVMVVKNNYMWLPDDHKAGFIANGDILVINKIFRFQERFGLRFAYASVNFQEEENQEPFEAWLLLDTLSAESPALPSEIQRKFFEDVHASYEDEQPDKRKRNALVRKDPFYNALQVKFSYAVTCHKAQGGQWSAVFVDQGYLPPEMKGIEFLRWLYTAVTRATKKLYLINFEERFFKT